MESRGSKKEKISQKVCDMCKQSSDTDGNDIVFFGEWMNRSDLTVHYYCLLLSTNLPQQGDDNVGILGFLLRDIRKEINMAKQRACIYCGGKSATIKCSICSDGYFHLICGHTNRCLYQFVDEFKSYCSNCLPLDEEQKELLKNPPDPIDNKCYICATSMGQYYPYRWIKAKCCKNGYVHSLCMKKYALASGYYLKCIWCKNANFREDVKRCGVFVPDRDANWERDNRFRDLSRGHMRCDMDICHCENGREYNKGRKWKIIICKLCGLVGAHNPYCIPGMEHEQQRIPEFKCETCSATEHTIREPQNERQIEENDETVDNRDINLTLYVNKGVDNNTAINNNTESSDFSDSSMPSIDTVIQKILPRYSVSTTNSHSPLNDASQVVAVVLTQSPDIMPLKEAETGRVIASSVLKLNLSASDNKFMQTIEESVQHSTQCEEIEEGAREDMNSNVFMRAADVPIKTHVEHSVTGDSDDDISENELINMAVDRLLDMFEI